MQRRAAWRRLAATGIAAALVAGFPASASAEPAPALGVVLVDTLLAPDSPGTLSEAIVFSSEPGTLHNLTVKFDAAGISTFIDVGVVHTDVCDAAGDVVTCTFDTVAADDLINAWASVALVPKPGAALGDEGELKVTVSADGVTSASDTATVSIAEGVDLAAEVVANTTGTPGGTYTQKFGVQNVGSLAAHGAVLEIFGDFGVEAGTPRYSNCTYVDNRPRTCSFDTDLAPGKSYGATIPFKLRADNMAPERQDVQLSWVTPDELAVEQKAFGKLGIDFVGEPGDGPALALTEKAKGELPPVEFVLKNGTKHSQKQLDEEPDNNWTYTTINVTGNNPADVAAVGDNASGAAGAEVGVQLGVKNNGPATIDPDNSAESFADVVFTVPPGSTVTDAPFDCAPVEPDGQVDWTNKRGEPGGRKYVCDPGMFLPAGERILFPFKLRIDTATPNAKGKVEVTMYYEERPPRKVIDSNPNNNVAYVVLNAAAPESPAPGDDNGGLPVTGTPAAIVAAVGLALAVVGFVLFRMARRRRLTEV